MKTILNLYKLYLIGVISILLITSACHKEGNGGKSNVSGYVKHHDKIIPYAVVYIKYGATEFPGEDVSKYDASVTADGSAHYAFMDLRKGDYYLYAVGYDDSGMFTVRGGIAVKLKYNKTTTTDVPVTE